ncbi:hypothetical protein M409DRAFT_25802 [Zasmidium cellare ATCC 36951]|uniref:Ubiquitin 3 binding protein But2 C-terminal domain-containing protein n=1 Tax=Zasmidium cellare ATCC 36951 TaxID=1080233 RepID=A0A6A6CAF1_ZASCE|nr:uncharacterized protein M409DRAFT_25802 [Zasmidium cellare ATCC 36951]KAF2164031.1 hypothetical protein M409DRAFT_25802 [Zasmidium cellare ATCC 36951]
MLPLLLFALLPVTFAQSLPTTSLFVPVEYVSNTFSASIAGSDAAATTYVFPPGCEDRSCGPVTVIQGPGTAIFNETDQPITTIYNCTLYPSSGDPTSASCTLSSTSPGYAFPSPVMMHYPADSGYAFPLYEAVITAGGSETSDVWGYQTTNSHRASLSNPLSEGSVIETGTATSASSSGVSTGLEASSATMPSSEVVVVTTTAPAVTMTAQETVSSSATVASASTSSTSTSEAGQSAIPLRSLLLVSFYALLARWFVV